MRRARAAGALNRRLAPTGEAAGKTAFFTVWASPPRACEWGRRGAGGGWGVRGSVAEFRCFPRDPGSAVDFGPRQSGQVACVDAVARSAGLPHCTDASRVLAPIGGRQVGQSGWRRVGARGSTLAGVARGVRRNLSRLRVPRAVSALRWCAPALNAPPRVRRWARGGPRRAGRRVFARLQSVAPLRRPPAGGSQSTCSKNPAPPRRWRRPQHSLARCSDRRVAAAPAPAGACPPHPVSAVPRVLRQGSAPPVSSSAPTPAPGVHGTAADGRTGRGVGGTGACVVARGRPLVRCVLAHTPPPSSPARSTRLRSA
jgi:hypothetical protein